MQLPGALDDMRLVDGDQTTAGEGAGRAQRYLELRRVVTVVVVHRDSVSLADELESTIDADEPRDRALCLGARNAGELERRKRRRGVLAIVIAMDRKIDVDRRQLPAAHNVRHAGEPHVEEVPQLRLRCVGRVVVELDVGDNRDLRCKRPDRAVGLVTLDDEPARPDTCVTAELRHDPADDEGRISTRLAEHERDHRSGRRLPMGAANNNRRLRRHELGEESGPRDALAAIQVRRRNDSLPAVGSRRLATDLDLDPVERLHEDGVAQIPAPNLCPERLGHVRVGRHPGSADPDEIQPPSGKDFVLIQHKVSRHRVDSTQSSPAAAAWEQGSAAGKRNQPLGNAIGCIDARHREHRGAHRREALRIGE